MVSFYLRSNLTMRVVGSIFGVSKDTVNKAVMRITKYIRVEKTKDNDNDNNKNKFYILDGTLVPSWDSSISNRSRNNLNSSNIQVIIENDTKIVSKIGNPVKGSTHDSKAFKDSGINKFVNLETTLADLGYIGTGMIIPNKKPRNIKSRCSNKKCKNYKISELRSLTKEQKEYNKKLRKQRASIERVLSVLKSWKILRSCRLFKTSLFNIFNTIAAFYNLRIVTVREEIHSISNPKHISYL